jgi:hypothetical protein
MYKRKFPIRKPPIPEKNVRVIKISKDAIFEFLYEKIIDDHDYLLGTPAVSAQDTFTVDWETGEFIFCAYKSEDKDGNLLELPKEIDLHKLMHNIPDTTDSLYSGKTYKEYTKEELIELSK